ncbi:homoserine O-acetyltransferase [Algoriphagus sp. CAU 1675]|uniref:homoserine O-acetyltransferase family protein n=1 Tax=Algoriphagus sp. CAU 1675 TaxID=3032597 RepID=UPI0023DCB9A4|nr:homoserine O-acetyltransferase [Algoriphagus sp. CAU 1675]MDF2157989.1 homoserine O-acetyltransferase [Algoriphagus sp. CAU 1675]
MNLKSQYASITMSQSIFHSTTPLNLESGESLPEFELVYSTYGQLNENKSNVVWVIHALTGDSNVSEWWSGLVGEDKFYDPADFFIVCANLLGSCYGSTSPLSINPSTGETYFYDFPHLSPRDLAVSLDRLRIHLELDEIHTLIGGSLGGQVGLEWAFSLGEKLKNAIILASTAKSSSWVKGFNEAQRMAIESDCTWGEKRLDAGKKGLEAARAIAMLSYRHPEDMEKKQSDTDEKLDNFRVSSYLRYQGQKLAKRFNALSYWTLTKAMDSHDLGRGRESAEKALEKISARVLTIGVNSDLLFLPHESRFISQHVQRGTYKEIQSTAGHDAFLIEFEQLAYFLKSFYLEENKPD